MASPWDTAAPTDRLRRPLLAVMMILASIAAVPAAGQDASADPALEELIPDSALQDPDGWASSEGDAAAIAEVEALALGDAGSDPAMPALPPTDPAADADFALPEDSDIAPVGEPEAIEFADLDTGRPQIAFAEAEMIAISDDLVLGFPQKVPPFNDRDDFIARFTALSAIADLDAKAENRDAQLGARAREDAALLAEMLRIYGFYDGEVVRTAIAAAPDGGAGAGTSSDRAQVRFDIIPGPRYRYGTIDLGALASAPDAAVLRAAFAIQPGDYLQSDTVVQEQFNLDRALGEGGYPFAAIADPQLVIDHDRREGDLTLAVTPGGKYAFGSVTSNDERFLSSAHLADIARFRPGDIYQRSLAMDLRRAITATGLVSSVSVTPRAVTPPSGDQPGVVAMDVALERAKLRTIAGAIGYGTEEGFRVQASWEHRNLFPSEGSLRLRGILGTREQLAGVTFRKNNFGGRDKVLTIDAYGSTVDTDAYDANTVAISGVYERTSTLLFQKPLSWALGAAILATDERNRVTDGSARPRQAYFIASLFGRGTVDTSDSLLDPTRGFRLTGFLGPETAYSEGTQYFYLRNQADASAYQAVSDRIVMAGRARLATVVGAPLEGIAPSRRLYGGGGASVRGYGYQSIGPQNEFGEPIGGRSLVEVSAEARIGTGLFGGAVSFVPFLDAGSVSTGTTPDFADIKIGAGIGLRYATGFGPIRVDVGVPLNPDPDDAPVGVYVSLGQAF